MVIAEKKGFFGGYDGIWEFLILNPPGYTLIELISVSFVSFVFTFLSLILGCKKGKFKLYFTC